jgi:hypothetical protein
MEKSKQIFMGHVTEMTLICFDEKTSIQGAAEIYLPLTMNYSQKKKKASSTRCFILNARHLYELGTLTNTVSGHSLTVSTQTAFDDDGV